MLLNIKTLLNILEEKRENARIKELAYKANPTTDNKNKYD
jgi:hypothetical protein